MDCEKFESAMMDELYGELDELTSAAVKRHIAGCARCAALLGGLRATRRVAVVPAVEPTSALEERIVAAAQEAQRVAPMKRRAARAVSLAGMWAMRPQTAMAALFLVMIGTSVLLLRGRSSRAPASAEMTVTEEGTPAPPPPAPSASVAAEHVPEPKSTPSIALGSGAAEVAVAAPRKPALPKNAPAARALASPATPVPTNRQENVTRCAQLDEVARSAGSTPAGWDALLQAAHCYAAIGDVTTARARYSALLGVESRRETARAELAKLDRASPALPAGAAAAAAEAPAAGGRAASKAASPRAAPPPAAAAPASAADSSGN